jgi:hypothetical protein
VRLSYRAATDAALYLISFTVDLPKRSSTKANWKQNSSRLREVESSGKPIRDKSTDAHGNLRDNTGFLKAERNALDNRGRTFDTTTKSWIRPEPRDVPMTEPH